MKDLLYTVANDQNGNLIKVNNAVKQEQYFCPVCHGSMILRNSGKTGKGSKRPHFAHLSLTPNCTPETALHYVFKNLLVAKIEQHLSEQTPIPISWKCKFCYEYHQGNLLRKTAAVKIEHNMEVCQPDIALFDATGKVYAVIEIVVTHKPDERVLSFYLENNITLIQINLKSDNDIEELENKIVLPDVVEMCVNKKCKKCNHFQHKTKMTIVHAPCWRCKSKMKVAIVEGGTIRGDATCGPEDFTEEELEIARKKGVIIKEHYSKTAEEKYLANTCGRCGAFAGQFYLVGEYLIPAKEGLEPYETFDIGYYCSNCVNIRDTERYRNQQPYN